MKLPSGIFSDDAGKKRQGLVDSLTRREAKLGGKLFGKIPETSRREFFYLGHHTWVWHEEWTDANSERHARTTRYIVRPNDIIKTSGDGSYERLTDTEVLRLYRAARLYQTNTHAAYQNLLESAAR